MLLVIYNDSAYDRALCTNDLCEDIVMNKLGDTCIYLKIIRVNNSKANRDKYNLFTVTNRLLAINMDGYVVNSIEQ